MSVEVNGLDDLIQKLETLADENNVDVDGRLKMMGQAAETLRGNLINVTPVRSGTLKRGWQMTTSIDGNTARAEVFNNVEYAAHVEYGHRVRGNSNKVIKGRFMVQRATDAFEPEFNEMLANQILENILS